MAVPDFQSLMLPFLEYVRDGKPHPIREIYSGIADQMGLSEAELTELLPSGHQSKYRNRLSWAGIYLRKAGLLQSPLRGVYQLTPRGEAVLNENHQKINIAVLNNFAEFKEFRQKQQTKKSEISESNALALEEGSESSESDAQTPEEMLEFGYQTLRDALAQEVLERVKQTSPLFFETLVVELLVKMGYGGSRQDAGKAVGRTGDGGIDGIIKEDKLGLDIIYVQAKRWSASVGRPDVQAFVGSLEGHRARKGVMITTSQFSSDAKHYVTQIGMKIILIDGEQLSELMIDYGLGVTTVATYDVRRIDSDYFSEE
jgi:restriction system protein